MASSSTATGIRCGGAATELQNHRRHRLVAGVRPIQMVHCSSDRRLRQLGVSTSTPSASPRSPFTAGEADIFSSRLSTSSAMTANAALEVEISTEETEFPRTPEESSYGLLATRMGGGEGGIVAEKLDEWMRDSVTEIVKNLTGAPLLVHVYSDEKGKKVETEKAVEEGDWKRLIERWRKRESPMPEGVIFVEQLHDGGRGAETEEEAEEEEATKAWGIVVQGKGGGECGPVCYLLKTSGVGSSGVGVCCTHFCLMRVNGFRESPKSQLKNCWLLQAQYDRLF